MILREKLVSDETMGRIGAETAHLLIAASYTVFVPIVLLLSDAGWSISLSGWLIAWWVAYLYGGHIRRAGHRAQKNVLKRAARLLDGQAEAHGECVHDYTDLLRLWADDDKRWEAGA